MPFSLKVDELLARLARGEPLAGGLTEVGWADRSLEGLPDMGIVSTAGDVLRYHAGLREGRLLPRRSFERLRAVRPGKINGLGYLVMSGERGTWEGNTGHAVGHLEECGDRLLELRGVRDVRQAEEGGRDRQPGADDD